MKDLTKRIYELAKENGFLWAENFNIVGHWNTEAKLAKGAVIKFGCCRIVREPIKFFTDYNGKPIDFIIEVFSANFEARTKKCKPETAELFLDRILLHELLHIDPLGEKLRGHNVQDFTYCLKNWGIDWLNPNEQLELLETKTSDQRPRFVEQPDGTKKLMVAP